MLHKAKSLMDTTDHSRTYYRARRRYIAKKHGGCDYCRPHRKDNASRPERCWKAYRRTQYRYRKTTRRRWIISI